MRNAECRMQNENQVSFILHSAFCILHWLGVTMPLVCRNCKRVNPAEALYCYWDGAVLDGQAR